MNYVLPVPDKCFECAWGGSNSRRAKCHLTCKLDPPKSSQEIENFILSKRWENHLYLVTRGFSKRPVRCGISSSPFVTTRRIIFLTCGFLDKTQVGLISQVILSALSWYKILDSVSVNCIASAWPTVLKICLSKMPELLGLLKWVALNVHVFSSRDIVYLQFP